MDKVVKNKQMGIEIGEQLALRILEGKTFDDPTETILDEIEQGYMEIKTKKDLETWHRWEEQKEVHECSRQFSDKGNVMVYRHPKPISFGTGPYGILTVPVYPISVSKEQFEEYKSNTKHLDFKRRFLSTTAVRAIMSDEFDDLVTYIDALCLSRDQLREWILMLLIVPGPDKTIDDKPAQTLIEALLVTYWYDNLRENTVNLANDLFKQLPDYIPIIDKAIEVREINNPFLGECVTYENSGERPDNETLNRWHKMLNEDVVNQLKEIYSESLAGTIMTKDK